MRRWLFNLAAAVSLVLCVAAVALQVRSYWVLDSTSRHSRRLGLALQTSKGEWMFSVDRNPGGIDDGLVNWQHRSSPAAPMGFDTMTYGKTMRFLDLHVIACQWGMGPTGFYQHTALVSGWLVIAPFMLAPAARIWFWFRSPRPGEKRCRFCGYDLRATPDRCPECGKAVGDGAIAS